MPLTIDYTKVPNPIITKQGYTSRDYVPTHNKGDGCEIKGTGINNTSSIDYFDRFSQSETVDFEAIYKEDYTESISFSIEFPIYPQKKFSSATKCRVVGIKVELDILGNNSSIYKNVMELKYKDYKKTNTYMFEGEVATEHFIFNIPIGINGVMPNKDEKFTLKFDCYGDFRYGSQIANVQNLKVEFIYSIDIVDLINVSLTPTDIRLLPLYDAQSLKEVGGKKANNPFNIKTPKGVGSIWYEPYSNNKQCFCFRFGGTNYYSMFLKK